MSSRGGNVQVTSERVGKIFGRNFFLPDLKFVSYSFSEKAMNYGPPHFLLIID